MSLTTILARFTEFATINSAQHATLPISYVSTSRSAAAALLFRDHRAPSFTGSYGDLPALVLVASGDIVGHSARRPPSASPPRGACLYEVIDPDSGFVLSWGILTSVPDLSTLGDVLHSPL
jgi:hypothetical protein